MMVKGVKRRTAWNFTIPLVSRGSLPLPKLLNVRKRSPSRWSRSTESSCLLTKPVSWVKLKPTYRMVAGRKC